MELGKAFMAATLCALAMVKVSGAQSGGRQLTDPAALYANIVEGMLSRSYAYAHILYLDPRLMTAARVTPQTLRTLGCTINITSASRDWVELTDIIRSEVVSNIGNSPMGEIRWGVILESSSSTRDELFFGPYYGSQSDNIPVSGYVNGNAVVFSPSLPKRLTAFIANRNCVPPNALR